MSSCEFLYEFTCIQIYEFILIKTNLFEDKRNTTFNYKVN
jgi:hypothetical protein